MKGFLQLENGEVFEGKFFGYHQGCFGEVVFNTAMTGYQEMLSDPSYYGQMVVMTYPLIGNYGINLEDFESDGPKIRALIVRERAQEPSNFRCEMDLDSYLKYAKVTGFEGLDTRKLTRILRDQGTMRGLITEHRMTKTELKNKLAEYDNTDAVYQVSTKEQYSSGDGETHVAV
ncbi:MAG TPA: carbamoyl phosphate synthase small subunit, partial [Eubacteriaceae bacterium]|nr:carbamoyl phosphate synthase small subunit [Eubacteriaceae bacterium]